MKFSAPAGDWPGDACGLGTGVGAPVLSRGGPFVFFVVHVKRANDEELAGGTCDFVHDFSRGTGRSFERDLNHVALDQFRRGRAARFRGRRNSLAGRLVSVLAMLRVLPATDDGEMT